MTRTVNIEVYADDDGSGGVDVFGVLSEHRADLPMPFDEQLQEWVTEQFGDLDKGDSIEAAGEMVYEPNDHIVEFLRK